MPEHRAGSHGTHEPRGWLCSAVSAWPRSHKHTRWNSSRSTTCRKMYVRMRWVVQRSLGGRLTLRLRSAIPGMCDCIRQIRQNQRCRAGTHAAAEAAVRGCVAVCVACAWLVVWLCKMPNSHTCAPARSSTWERRWISGRAATNTWKQQNNLSRVAHSPAYCLLPAVLPTHQTPSPHAR